MLSRPSRIVCDHRETRGFGLLTGFNGYSQYRYRYFTQSVCSSLDLLVCCPPSMDIHNIALSLLHTSCLQFTRPLGVCPPSMDIHNIAL
jgi:hypothetical protein